MKIKLLLFAFTITLLTSCNSFDTIIEKQRENILPYYGGCEQKIFFTNTSKSKFLEVTIKEKKGDNSIGTYIRRVRPGVTDYIRIECNKNTDFSVVGEREITSDE
jgi:hypothetical protein